MLGLTQDEERFLRCLDTPQKVQDFLDSIPFNFEVSGETCKSPRKVLQTKMAHCMEGALLACAAFMLQGRKPYLLSLKVGHRSDQDHAVTLFKEDGYWGAVSKTNHAVLRYRDPVYRTVRELAMSYFHEYFLVSDGTKTMRGYSLPINLRRFGAKWITKEEDLWEIAETIYDSHHLPAIPKQNEKFIRKATSLERKAAKITAFT